MTQGLATIEAAGVSIDHDAILKSLKLNPRDPNTQALLLVCDRYGLDPLLKHVVLITGNAYVTRDGYLAIAHRSGTFDGIEVVDVGETNTHYTAKVAVYRKDMSHPFTYVGRFPKSKQMAKEYGPEMAIKVAEVQALRRAFNVTGVGAADERWDDGAAEMVSVPTNVDPDTGEVLAIPTKAEPTHAPPPKVATKRPPPGRRPEPEAEPFPLIDPGEFEAMRATIAALPDELRAACREELHEAGLHTAPGIEAAGVEGLEAAKTIVAGYVAAAGQEAG